LLLRFKSPRIFQARRATIINMGLISTHKKYVYSDWEVNLSDSRTEEREQRRTQ
jgi:hypothetical protein